MGIDIASIAKSGVKIAMELAGTAKRTVTIASGGVVTYDPATDAATVSGGDPFSVEALVYEERERDPENILGPNMRQRVAIVEVAKIPAGRTIERDGTMTEPGGEIWHIKEVAPDPVSATIKLFLS